MGGPAGPLSVASNLPPAISPVGPRGVLRTVLEILAQALHDEDHLNLQEAFIDGSFAPAKRDGTCVGKTKRGKGSKIMAIANRQGRPVAVHIEGATPHEVTLVHVTLAERFVSQLPARLRRQRLRVGQIGCRTGAPWRGTDCASPEDPDTAETQDGRPLRRYRRRWKVGRLFCLVAELSAGRRPL
jgi:hypothetical protein